MAKTLSPTEAYLAPLAKLAVKHPDIEAEVIWDSPDGWEPQSGDDARLEGEEIAFYAEGLLMEGFQMQYQILADTDAPKDAAHVRLFFWQAGAPDLPSPEDGLVVIGSATWTV